LTWFSFISLSSFLQCSAELEGNLDLSDFTSSLLLSEWFGSFVVASALLRSYIFPRLINVLGLKYFLCTKSSCWVGLSSGLEETWLCYEL
jgi:hypothetical protein